MGKYKKILLLSVKIGIGSNAAMYIAQAMGLCNLSRDNHVAYADGLKTGNY